MNFFVRSLFSFNICNIYNFLYGFVNEDFSCGFKPNVIFSLLSYVHPPGFLYPVSWISDCVRICSSKKKRIFKIFNQAIFTLL